MKFRAIMTICVLAFVITLAVVVGQRLSSEAMAVLLGVIAGVAASIPTSLIVVWLATRTQQQPVHRAEVRRNDSQPTERVVVIAQPQVQAPQQQQPWTPAVYSPQPPFAPHIHQPRRFTIIGGSDNSDDGF